MGGWLSQQLSEVFYSVHREFLMEYRFCIGHLRSNRVKFAQAMMSTCAGIAEGPVPAVV